MDAAAELGRNSVSMEMIRLTRDGTVEPVFSGANADREMFIFPVQLTTSRIGELIRSILTLAIYLTRCSIHTYKLFFSPTVIYRHY